MVSKKKCPFRKITLYNTQNFYTGVAINSTEENFGDCLYEQCVAYQKFPVSDGGFCGLCRNSITNEKEN